jgi:hypothetical protein
MSRRYVVCIDVVNYICYGLFEIGVTRRRQIAMKALLIPMQLLCRCLSA